MSGNESCDYQIMKEEDSYSPKLNITKGDIFVPNKENEAFLCFFIPKEIDIQCFCGCDLNSGMKVVAGFIFYIMAFHFFQIIFENNYRTYFICTILCSCYLITIFNIFQTLEELSYEKAVFNYRFFMIVYFSEIIILILETLYLIIYEPLYFTNYTYFGLFFSYGSIIVTLLIEQYMLWITFCFMQHIKNDRLYLLQDINHNNLFAITP